MQRWRLVVVVISVLVWGLSAPLAMASNDCMTMGAICEGPCGAHQCALSRFESNSALELVLLAIVPSLDGVPSAALQVPELPPKPSSSSA